MLEDDGYEDVLAGDQIARLDFFALVDPVFVQPLPFGDVENVEEPAQNPVGNDRDSKGEDVVRSPRD